MPEEILHAITLWSPVIVLIASLVNAFTKHYSEYSGVAKLLTMITEMLSIITSAGRKTDLGGRVKPPVYSATKEV